MFYLENGFLYGKRHHLVAEIKDPAFDHLLAAAPELLEALKAELEARCGKGLECEVCGGNGSTLAYHAECCAKSRAALAKAEGK